MDDNASPSPAGNAAVPAASLLGGLKQRGQKMAGGMLTQVAVSAAKHVTQSIERTPEARRTFFENAEFPFAARLEQNWRIIRQELDAVMRGVDLVPNFQDLMQEQRTLTQDDRWKSFPFYGYGVKFEDNCRRCPETSRLLESIPGMTSAFFSILRGHKHLPPHRGHYKGVLRYHLGLLVPEPADQCRIRVGQDTASWREGKSLIFDDTHDHEVWKTNEGDRVVLFVDFRRPLPPLLDGLNRMVVKMISLSPYIQQTEKYSRRWEETFGHEFDLRRATPGT